MQKGAYHPEVTEVPEGSPCLLNSAGDFYLKFGNLM
jgi:hypothetical protein